MEDMGDFAGTLVLVVGPSGAGKDTVLDGARRLLDDDRRFHFPRRVITRPADAGGEDHIAVGEREFLDARGRGGFALDWQAHGLRYGVPREIEHDMAQGRSVVVNASRTVLEAARARYAGTQAVFVTASPHVLAERLATRNRESDDDIRARLARLVPPPAGDGIWQLRNDGTIEDAVAEFVGVLYRIAANTAAVPVP